MIVYSAYSIITMVIIEIAYALYTIIHCLRFICILQTHAPHTIQLYWGTAARAWSCVGLYKLLIGVHPLCSLLLLWVHLGGEGRGGEGGEGRGGEGGGEL